MLQRTGKRLLDLRRNWSHRVIGEAMILAVLKGVLGLQEEILPLDQAALDSSRDSLTDRCFVVVLPLIGGIDAAKALFEGKFHERLGAVLLPSRSVQETGEAHATLFREML